MKGLRNEFLAIASRDDAESFAVRWYLSRAYVDQNPAPRYLGVWEGQVDGIRVRMTLRWFEEVTVSAEKHRLDRATLIVGSAAPIEVTYKE